MSGLLLLGQRPAGWHLSGLHLSGPHNKGLRPADLPLSSLLQTSQRPTMHLVGLRSSSLLYAGLRPINLRLEGSLQSSQLQISLLEKEMPLSGLLLQGLRQRPRRALNVDLAGLPLRNPNSQRGDHKLS